MFYCTQSQEAQNKYKTYLQLIGSLSHLFSDSNVPYLYYRIAEKVFCNVFDAKDLSRGDVSYDAQKMGLGIGLKTFLKNRDNTLQKIAEFNRALEHYQMLSPNDKIKQVAILRNERLTFTNTLHTIDEALYHCVVRDKGRFYLFEEKIDFINIEAIRNIKKNRASITFDDGKHEYSFFLSKSTLMKRFLTTNFVDEFEIDIIENPLTILYDTFGGLSQPHISLGKGIEDSVYLPLYSKGYKVAERSGLNQWNAQGRVRNANEVYIPIPAEIHKYKPNFFPQRDIIFQLHLPHGKVLDAKVCQDNSKALMSNPNSALGKWILRDLFRLEEGQLVTIERLLLYGIDSVRVDKLDDVTYEINFAKLHSYEEFMISLRDR
jgi:hypothetical protein